MSTKMTPYNFLRFLVVWVALLAIPVSSLAAELSVEDYVSLTIKRLELARDCWRDEKRSPTEAEESTLFESFEITPEAYYSASSELHQRVQGYLEENPSLADTIESLSRQIEQLIEQAE